MILPKILDKNITNCELMEKYICPYCSSESLFIDGFLIHLLDIKCKQCNSLFAFDDFGGSNYALKYAHYIINNNLLIQSIYKHNIVDPVTYILNDIFELMIH